MAYQNQSDQARKSSEPLTAVTVPLYLSLENSLIKRLIANLVLK